MPTAESDQRMVPDEAGEVRRKQHTRACQPFEVVFSLL